MKAIILDGARADDEFGKRVRESVVTALENEGWSVEPITLREKRIGNCAGDFFCWVRTPGMCTLDDDNRAIAASIIQSDLLVYLTPVTFGGYSSILKRMVDHQIQLIEPFFTRIDGEVHHKQRYDRSYNFLCVGWQESTDAQSEGVFRRLAHRNGINFYCPTVVADVLQTSLPEDAIRVRARQWLEALADSRSSASPAPAGVTKRGSNALSKPKRALFLIGSPRLMKSNSASIARHFAGRLEQMGVESRLEPLFKSLRSDEGREALLKAVKEADLLFLVAPLYVDSLPAPVIEALEIIALRGRETLGQPQKSIGAILNCGFPEAAHNGTALAICERFAAAAGYSWIGALALGGGEMIRGEELEKLGGQTFTLRRALDSAATAVAGGLSIPEEAVESTAKPVIPRWLYLIIGSIGWRLQARRFHAARKIGARPYAESRK